MKKVLLFSFLLLFFRMDAQTQLDTAVNFVATDIYGNSHDLFAYLDEGKHVILDFFYTDCAPCIGLIPEMSWAMENYGCNQGDLVMLSVNYDDYHNEVTQYANEHGTLIPAISGIEGNGNEIITAYGIYAFPTAILIAPNRQILHNDIFPISQANLMAAIEGQAGVEPLPVPCSGWVTATQTAEPPAIPFQLFPNPAGERVVIQTEAALRTSVQWEILDLLGRCIRSGQMGLSPETSLSLRGIPSGCYQIRLSGSDFLPSVRQLIVR